MRQGTLKLKRLMAATFRVFFLFPSSCIFYRSEILSVFWLLVSLKTVNDYQKKYLLFCCISDDCANLEKCM